MTQRIERPIGRLVLVVLATLVTACGDNDHMNGTHGMEHRERPADSGSSK